MTKRSTGNGHQKTRISITTHHSPEQRWVLFVPDEKHPPELEDVPIFLDKTLQTWLKDHPGTRVRSTLGVVQNGQTVAIHLWYDTFGQE